jgi:hypothetical protein
VVAAKQNLNWLLGTLPISGAVLACAALCAGESTSDDDFNDAGINEVEELPLRRAPRMTGAEQFRLIVFADAPAHQVDSLGYELEQVLQRQVEAVAVVCGLTSGQEHKLELAGRGDIKRICDRIEELRMEFQLYDDHVGRKVPEALRQQATELRGVLDSGLFNDNSLFVKTLRYDLDGGQWAIYESYRQIEHLGGRAGRRERDARQINAIRMTAAEFTDDGLVHFKPLNGLECLVLAYTQVTDRGLVHLSGLTNLEVLDLGSTQVAGAGLAQLSAMQRLQVLDLRRTPISDAAVVHLAHLTNLRVLNLEHTQVTGARFAKLATLRNLETLVLRQTPFTDEGLTCLQGLQRLKELVFEGTQITDTGLSRLARLTSLEKLDLRRTAISDMGVAHLTRLTNLKSLYLDDTRVTPAAIIELKRSLPNTRVVR